jgi:hypothetical protein
MVTTVKKTGFEQEIQVNAFMAVVEVGKKEERRCDIVKSFGNKSSLLLQNCQIKFPGHRSC